ncbi:hypothetical protein JRQ81_016380, partial [Phrynocephalus forsythii]
MILSEASDFYNEAMTVAAQRMRSARHISDRTTRLLGSAITLCHHSWLHSTDLAEDTKGQIEHLSFE